LNFFLGKSEGGGKSHCQTRLFFGCWARQCRLCGAIRQLAAGL